MARRVGIGHEDFAVVRESNNFYVDKTNFIREWWESNDRVTLITRPRRFGKTLNMSMLEIFFSVNYAGRSDLFEGLSVWENEQYRNLQGSYPVIFLSFANVKETSYKDAKKKICYIIEKLYNRCEFLMEGTILNEKEKQFVRNVCADMEEYAATSSLGTLSEYLSRYYGKKVLILLDEYDTPMQEAWMNGYWDEMVSFIRNLFNSTFKTNPYLEKAVMIGITRVSRESVFSDLNNLKVITTTSEKYADCFGFTEEEVFAALDEFGMSEQKQQVKDWYDGFTFGDREDIYNPWSVISFLSERRVGTYWVNTSSNSLVGKLLQEGSRDVKEAFETLLQGGSIIAEIDEQIVYSMLGEDEQALWSLLLAGGYLKVRKSRGHTSELGEWKQEYELELTNFEVKAMFRKMVRRWFGKAACGYNDFIKALLADDIKAMNIYMNKVAMNTFSYFDTGKNPSKEEPERFYHGFVLGLMVELADRYLITSNRESGFGRYDLVLEPRRQGNGTTIDANAIIIEFKVQEAEEKDLSDTVQDALRQIRARKYETALVTKGIPMERIRMYGFAFRGKKVLIGSANESA